MKPVTKYVVGSLLCCLCAVCYADDKGGFYLVSLAAHTRNSKTATSAVLPRNGCVRTGAILLPALFGGAGMRQLVHLNATRNTCAFHVVSERTPGPGFAYANKEQRASEILQMKLNGNREGTSSAGSVKADLVANKATQEIGNGVVAAPKPAPPLSGRSAPKPLLDRISTFSGSRRVKSAASPHPDTMPKANYPFLLIASVLVLALALLALLGASVAVAYFQWFRERATLARAVKRGLRRNEFRLEYQPVYYTKTRKCIGLEVVLLWKNVAYGLRGEGWYMDKLADSRAITKIVAFILSTAETELDLLANGRNLYLMVNLWESCLGNEDCLSLIATKASSFASCRLVFQIRADDVPARLSSVVRLRRDKVRIALSGVRTSSAITSSMLPPGFEFIKIDRDVMRLEESDRLRTLQAIAAMGRELDVAVIADGVEGVGQNQAVGSAEIALAQGFFLGKALSAAQLPMLFEKLDWWQGEYVPTASAVGRSR